jgi:hypothetical protein
MLDRMLIGSQEQVLVEDVFSTFLYTGDGSASRNITTGINMNAGGLIWVKSRSALSSHLLFDTARGATKYLSSNGNAGQTTDSTTLTSFNQTGFSVGNSASINALSSTYAAWTFRKAPKFFDVVTYTGNGTYQTINHGLNVAPGFMVVKRLDASPTSNWPTYHRSFTSASYYATLNVAGTQTLDTTVWNATAPNYVAYLFAHDTAADGMIQCGSYIGTSTATPFGVTIGWEPQWLMIQGTASPLLFDSQRGVFTGYVDPSILAGSQAAEQTATDFGIAFRSDGFEVASSVLGTNSNGALYTYVAVRRGPMRTPTAGTNVFNMVSRLGTNATGTVAANLPGPTDLVFIKQRNYPGTGNQFGFIWNDRTISNPTGAGVYLTSSNNAALAAATSIAPNTWDTNDGFNIGDGNQFTSQTNWSSITYMIYMLRRAPGFFDLVSYRGNYVNRTIPHNLGVVPELMIIKGRSVAARNWTVYYGQKDKYLLLNTNAAAANDISLNRWNNTNPTASVFSLGNVAEVNEDPNIYSAYLFASCPGVSKVGTYIGNGTSQTINCGFSAGARFILIKRVDAAGDWFVFDTVRGIGTTADPSLAMNIIDSETSPNDDIVAASSGFTVAQNATRSLNASGGTYTFFAIA